MAKSNIASVVKGLAKPIADELGLILWDVEFVKEGADLFLRIIIDKDGGVTLDDCEAMHNRIDPVLDEKDPIDCSYHLEVSSPGVCREITEGWQVDYCKGETVEAKLYAPLNGTKIYKGILTGRTDDGYRLLVGENEVVLPQDKISKLTVAYEFD